VARYGVDQTRFFMMSEVNFGNDGDYSDQAMVQKCNTNLANELGNLCQRTLTMVFKNCDKCVPEHGEFTADDEALLSTAHRLGEVTGAAMSVQSIQKYVEAMVSVIWDANKYIDTMAPWVLRKEDPARMATVLYVIMDVLRCAAVLYQPLIPSSSNMILDAMSVPADERTFAHLSKAYMLRPGTQIPPPVPIFPRIEAPELLAVKA
jgi:methionyl-tRNA synthetase